MDRDSFNVITESTPQPITAYIAKGGPILLIIAAFMFAIAGYYVLTVACVAAGVIHRKWYVRQLCFRNERRNRVVGALSNIYVILSDTRHDTGPEMRKHVSTSHKLLYALSICCPLYSELSMEDKRDPRPWHWSLDVLQMALLPITILYTGFSDNATLALLAAWVFIPMSNVHMFFTHNAYELKRYLALQHELEKIYLSIPEAIVSKCSMRSWRITDEILRKL